jgi:hypothetical protein
MTSPRHPRVPIATSRKIRRTASGRLASGAFASLQRSSSSRSSGCRRSMIGVPLPDGAGPFRFLDTTVACSVISDVIPQ